MRKILLDAPLTWRDIAAIANGARLAWLIDPFNRKVYIYRPGEPVQLVENPTTIAGDPVLPGFVFDIAQIWQR